MGDDLSAFHDESEEDTVAADDHGSLELLVLAQGSLLLGVPATSVDSVVPWSEPTPIPESSARVLGVVQDRGRLVAVTRPLDPNAKMQRLVVCGSSLGLVGIPASSTRSVGSIVLRSEHSAGRPVMTDQGSITMLDVEALANDMVNGL